MASYPNTDAASAVWSLRDVYKAEAGDEWPSIPVAPAPSQAPVYLMDGESGSINDKTGNHSYTVFSDPVASTAQKKLGSYSVQFDTNDSFTFARDVSDRSITLECWIYPLRTSALERFWCSVDRDGPLNNSELLFIFQRDADGTLKFYGTSGALRFTSTDPVPQDQWTHLAYTYDSATSTGRFFINGDLKTESAGSLTGGSTRNDIFLGRYGLEASSSQFNFNGYLDEVAIFEYPRYLSSFTPSDIQIATVL